MHYCHLAGIVMKIQRVQLQQVDAGCVAAVPYGNNGPHKGLKLPVSIKKHLCECYESTQ